MEAAVCLSVTGESPSCFPLLPYSINPPISMFFHCLWVLLFGLWHAVLCLVECYYIWLFRRIMSIANYNERRVVSDVKYSPLGVTIFRMNLMEMGSTYVQYYMFFLLLQVPVVELECLNLRFK